MATLLGARMDVQSRAVRHAAGGKPKSLKCAGPQRRGISHKSAGVLEVLCEQELPHAGGSITSDTNDEMGSDWHGFRPKCLNSKAERNSRLPKFETQNQLV